MAPGLKRVALLGDPANHNFMGFKKSFEAAATTLSVEPIAVPIRGADDIERGVRSLAEAPNGGLIVSAASFSIVHRDRIVGLANRRKLPAIYWNRVQVEAGGLMSYGPDTTAIHGRSAGYVDRILKGEASANLPVQASTKLDLTINARTGKGHRTSHPARDACSRR
jgi:putative ABC transport system substrate-binding protein